MDGFLLDIARLILGVGAGIVAISLLAVMVRRLIDGYRDR